MVGGGHRSLFGGWGGEEENGKLFKKYTCVENSRTVRLSCWILGNSYFLYSMYFLYFL